MIFAVCTLDSRGSCTIIALKISKLMFKFTKAKQNETRACKVKIKILSKKYIYMYTPSNQYSVLNMSPPLLLSNSI